MPLGHCFVEAGDALTAEDKAAIEKMVDSGMSQAEAVDSLMSDVDQQIDSITSQVEAQGGEVRRLEQAEAEGPIKGFFDPEAMRITLTKDADLSTLMHELAHMFLSVYQIYENADPSIAEDLAILDKWFAENGAETDVAKQETFASGFEMYLMEGKAPTPELQSIFSKFKAWLTLVYKNINRILRSDTGEPVTLTKEVREVMDRMLATEEAINQAQAESSFGPLPTQELGLSEENAAEYVKLSQEAREEASTDLTARVMADLKREQDKWWKDGVERYKQRVEQELNDRPEYEARDHLSGVRILEGVAPVKLNSKYVFDNYAGSNPRKLRHMMNKGGEHPDTVAPFFGYQTGDELVRALLGTMNKTEQKQYIQAQAEQMMKDEHGDMLSDNDIPAAAERAVHNEKQAKLLSMELEFINKRLDPTFVTRGTTRAARQAYQASAREQVRKTPVDQLMPHIHLRNEQKHGREALHFAAKGKWAEARLAKHKQIRQFYLYRESLKAKEQAEKHRARLRQMQTTKYSARQVDPDFIQTMKVLIAAYDLRKNPKQSDELLARVRSFIEAQKDSNPDLIANSRLSTITSWKSMSVDDLEALRESAENILHIGKLLGAAEKEARKAENEDTVAFINKHGTKTEKLPLQNTLFKGASSFYRGAKAVHRKFESIIRQAEGYMDEGPLQRRVVRPLVEAANNEIVMRRKAHEELTEIFKGHEHLFKMWQNRNIPGGSLGNLSRGDVIVLALNWGNEGNRQALLNMEKYPLTEQEVVDAISTLSDTDLDLVEEIWKYIDSYWSQISAVEQKATGISPRKVEADPFVINGRTMRGGYYPIQGDFTVDALQNEHEVQERAKQLLSGVGSVRASTKHGSTIERQGWGGKAVKLSIDGLFSHIDGIIHDITHREAVAEADRILRNKEIKSAIQDAVGEENTSQLSTILTRVAAGHISPSELSAGQKFLRYTRIGLTYNVMGYSFRTALVNVTGFASAVPEIGKARMAVAAMEFLGSPFSKSKEITDASPYMRNRAEVVSRDVYDVMRNMRGSGTLTKVKSNAFIFITKIDALVSRIIWTAAYEKAMAEQKSEKDAIYYADRVVRTTQGSGLLIDQAAIESSNEFVKAFTTMYSYFNSQLQLIVEQRGKAQLGQISKAKLIENLMWIMGVTAFLEWFIIDAGFGFDLGDEPEKELEELAKSIASYNLGYFVGLREASSLVKYGIQGSSPIGSFMKQIYDLGVQVEQGEVDKALIRAAAGTVSTGLHIPGGVQIGKTIGTLIEAEEQGEDVNPFQVLVTGKVE